MSEKSSSGGGIGCGGVIQIVFLILKLTNLIDWPWIWVLSPTWIGLLLFLVAVLFVGIIIWIKDNT